MIQRRGAVGEQHVCLQQPQRPPVITGRGFRARQGDHPRQLHPVTSTQRDDMILRPGHDSDSSRSSINREQPTSNTNQIKSGTLLDCVDYRGNRHVGVFNPTPATMREPFVDAVVEHLTNGLAHDGVVTTARLDERITRS